MTICKAGTRGKVAGEQINGDPDKAFQEAEVVSEGALRHSGDQPLLPGASRPVIQWEGDNR